jgi:hypothetical protein
MTVQARLGDHHTDSPAHGSHLIIEDRERESRRIEEGPLNTG